MIVVRRCCVVFVLFSRAKKSLFVLESVCICHKTKGLCMCVRVDIENMKVV
jgi:hypothetical protein